METCALSVQIDDYSEDDSDPFKIIVVQISSRVLDLFLVFVNQTGNFVKDLFFVCYGAKRMFYMHHILELIIKIHDNQGIYHFTKMFIYF